MSTHTFRAAFRPLRIAWCVRDGRQDDVERAIQLTTCLWGGRYNPIIPVGHELSRTWVEFFRVDALFPIAEDPAIEAFLAAFPNLPWPDFHREIFIKDGEQHRPTLLDLYHPIRHLYETHIRNVAEPKVTASLLRWEPTDPLRLILACLAGDFPAPPDAPDYRGLIEKYLAAKTITIVPTDPLPLSLQRLLTPAALTTLDLRPHHRASWGMGWESPGLYVGSATDLDDIIRFWNLRAGNVELLFYDPAHSTRLVGLREDFLSQLRARPHDPSGWRDSIHIWTHTDDGAATAADFGPDMTRVLATEGVWNGLNLRPPLMHFPEHSLLASVADEHGRLAATFQVPEKPFFDDGSVFYAQEVVLSIRPLIDISTREDVTFRAPYVPELNEFYGRRFHFHPDRMRVEADGLAQILSVSDDHTTINAVPVRDLVQEIFASFGITARPSQPGLIASRLIGNGRDSGL